MLTVQVAPGTRGEPQVSFSLKSDAFAPVTAMLLELKVCALTLVSVRVCPALPLWST